MTPSAIGIRPGASSTSPEERRLPGCMSASHRGHPTELCLTTGRQVLQLALVSRAAGLVCWKARHAGAEGRNILDVGNGFPCDRSQSAVSPWARPHGR